MSPGIQMCFGFEISPRCPMQAYREGNHATVRILRPLTPSVSIATYVMVSAKPSRFHPGETLNFVPLQVAMRAQALVACLAALAACAAAQTIPLSSSIVLRLQSAGLAAGNLRTWPDSSVRDLECVSCARGDRPPCCFCLVLMYHIGCVCLRALVASQGRGFNATTNNNFPVVTANARYCTPAVYFNQQSMTITDNLLLRPENAGFSFVVVAQASNNGGSAINKNNGNGADYQLQYTSPQWMLQSQTSGGSKTRAYYSSSDTTHPQVRRLFGSFAVALPSCSSPPLQVLGATIPAGNNNRILTAYWNGYNAGFTTWGGGVGTLNSSNNLNIGQYQVCRCCV